MFNLIFELAPDYLQLFPFKDDSDEEYQRKLLAHSSRLWKVLYNAANDWDANLEYLKKIGNTHQLKDVIKEHYELMKYAIEQTVEEALGGEFTKSRKAAFLKFFQAIAEVMVQE